MASNFLYLKLNWSADKSSVSETDSSFRDGVMELRADRLKTFIFDQQIYCHDSNFLCALLGYLNNFEAVSSKWNINVKNDVELILYLYEKLGTDFIKELDGVFLIVIYNLQTSDLLAVQSRYGFSLPVYFHQDNYRFILSTKKREILSDDFDNLKLDTIGAREFLFYEKVIPNKKTLITGINKLLTNELLSIDYRKNKVSLTSNKPSLYKINAKQAMQEILSPIKNNVYSIQNSSLAKEIFLTLTAGWDTNLVLYYLNSIRNNENTLCAINASCGEAVSELNQVEKILENYESVNLLSECVPNSVVEDLPDMVSIYEGYLFETAMFLRYHLANALSEQKANSIYTGACADQIYSTPVLNWIIKYTKTLMENKDAQLRLSLFHPQQKNEMNATLDYLLKMHGIVFNAYGIQCLFPFITVHSEVMHNALGIKNFKKKIYKERIRELFGSKLVGNISKSGKVIENNLYFDEYKSLLLRVLDKDITLEIIGPKLRDKLNKSPEQYASFIFQLVYIYTFNEIFVENISLNKKIENGQKIKLSEIL